MTPKLNLRERLIDPNSPDRRPRKAAYALPALFTAGNLFLGFLAILKAIEGALFASGSWPEAMTLMSTPTRLLRTAKAR